MLLLHAFLCTAWEHRLLQLQITLYGTLHGTMKKDACDKWCHSHVLKYHTSLVSTSSWSLQLVFLVRRGAGNCIYVSQSLQ